MAILEHVKGFFGTEENADKIAKQHPKLAEAVEEIKKLDYYWKQKVQLVRNFVNSWDKGGTLIGLTDIIKGLRKLEKEEEKEILKGNYALVMDWAFLKAVEEKRGSSLSRVLRQDKRMAEKWKKYQETYRYGRHFLQIWKQQFEFCEKYMKKGPGETHAHLNELNLLLKEEGDLLNIEKNLLIELSQLRSEYNEQREAIEQKKKEKEREEIAKNLAKARKEKAERIDGIFLDVVDAYNSFLGDSSSYRYTASLCHSNEQKSRKKLIEHLSALKGFDFGYCDASQETISKFAMKNGPNGPIIFVENENGFFLMAIPKSSKDKNKAAVFPIPFVCYSGHYINQESINIFKNFFNPVNYEFLSGYLRLTVKPAYMLKTGKELWMKFTKGVVLFFADNYEENEELLIVAEKREMLLTNRFPDNKCICKDISKDYLAKGGWRLFFNLDARQAGHHGCLKIIEWLADNCDYGWGWGIDVYLYPHTQIYHSDWNFDFAIFIGDFDATAKLAQKIINNFDDILEIMPPHIEKFSDEILAPTYLFLYPKIAISFGICDYEKNVLSRPFYGIGILKEDEHWIYEHSKGYPPYDGYYKRIEECNKLFLRRGYEYLKEKYGKYFTGSGDKLSEAFNQIKPTIHLLLVQKNEA